MAVSRRSASSASRASACASARTSASCARLPSISERMSASWRSRSADGGSSARPLSATSRLALGLVAAGDQPGLGLGQRGDARGVARHLALGHGVEFAGVVGLALRRAPVLACGGLRRRRPRSGPLARPRRPCACPRASCARGHDFAIDVGEAAALRRAGARRRSAHGRRRQSRPSARDRRRAKPAAGRA